MALWKRRDRRAPLSRAEIELVFEPWPDDDLYRLRRSWTARYLPLWYVAHEQTATAAGWTPEKVAKHRDAVDHALERCDGWWAGDKVVKARRNEIESAVSAVTHYSRQARGGEPWVEQARNAALVLRHFLQFVGARDNRDWLIGSMGHAVYNWAEIETWWPGDTAYLLSRLTPEERAVDGGHHLLYGRAATREGLRQEGEAVVAAVHEIMANLDQVPGPYPVEPDFLRRGRAGLARRQRQQGYVDFHGTRPPEFLR